MQDDYQSVNKGRQSVNKDRDYIDPIVMTKTAHTKSHAYLMRFAVPYTLIYVFMPALLQQIGLPLSGLWLSILVIVLLNIAVIGLFKAQQKRQLEKIECHRMGFLTSLLTLIVTSLLMIYSLYDLSASELSMAAFKQNKVMAMLIISGAIGFAINYVAIVYGLWFLQKLWPQTR